MLKNLMAGPFPGNLASILYPRRKPGDITFVEPSYKVQEPNVFLPKYDSGKFEHDAILVFNHLIEGRAGGGFRDVISIEIKTTAGNIFKSTVDQYVGATRLFFIAAPEDLLPVILCKHHFEPKRQLIGVIDGDAGHIVMLPQFQNYDKDRRDRLLSQCFRSIHRLPGYYDAELYGLHQVQYPAYAPPEWVFKDGLRLNPDYMDLYACEADAGFDLKRFRHVK